MVIGVVIGPVIGVVIGPNDRPGDRARVVHQSRGVCYMAVGALLYKVGQVRPAKYCSRGI